ncbi:MAG: carbohydrate-binding domain-containing protein [Clostridia bacterium]|nr:carbohydrate-binding domain-containing protein [Clostridia bacterium]
MKKLFALLLAMICALMIVSCGDEEGTAPSTPSSAATTSSDTGTPPKPDQPLGPSDTYQPPADYDKPTVQEVLGELMNVFTAEDTFGNESKVQSFTDYTDIDVSKVTNTQVVISQGGVYRVHGKNANCQLYLKAQEKGTQKVYLLLDGLDLSYSGSSPVIFADDFKEVHIVLAKGSYNTLRDSATNGENGAIKVKSCNLVLDGTGKLTITANAKHGISNTKELTINGGNYNITSVGHGIYGKQGVIINGGKYNISSAKSGIKAGDDEVGNEYVGKIEINSGSIKIRSTTNGINSYGTVSIINGRITVESNGKGIVATNDLNISGGTLILSTVEDTIKSDASVNITGKANIKITTNGNGVEAVNATVSTTGVIYIKTMPVFTKDVTGSYIYVNGAYVHIEDTDDDSGERYAVAECKGFEIKEKLTLNKATIGVDSFEDGLNAATVDAQSGKLVISTTRDGVDASNEVVIGGTVNVNIVDSNKGIKAATKVTLSAGETTVTADTDAIKADTVSIVSGKHILFEKVEYVTDFTIRGGVLLCVSTTNNPVSIKATIPNASGVIVNKDMCKNGQLLTLAMGTETVGVVLTKDFTEKMSVLYAAPSQGQCLVIIGQDEKRETLVQGSFYG